MGHRSHVSLAAASLLALVVRSALGTTVPAPEEFPITGCRADDEETALIQTVAIVNKDHQGSTASSATVAIVNKDHQGSTASSAVSEGHANAERPTLRRQEMIIAELLELAPDIANTSSWIDRALAAVAIVAVCSGLVCFFFCRCMPAQKDDPALWGICYSQLLSIGVVGLMCWGNMTPLTTAYDMMVSLGYGASFSGLIIGGYWALGVPSLLLGAWLTKPWSQAFSWATCVCCIAITGSFQLIFMAISFSSRGMTESLCLWLLILTRAVMGFASTTVELLAKLMAQKVTPKEDMVNFQIQYSSSTVLGLAMGPLLSSAICIATAAQSPGSRMGFPSGFVGLLWLAVVPFVWFFVPRDLDAILGREPTTTPLNSCWAKTRNRFLQGVSNVSTIVTEDAGSPPDVVAPERKVIWWSAVFYELERITSQVAIEVASSLILEVEFHWDPTKIGVVVAAGFLIGVPVNEVFLVVRKRYQLSDTTIARFSAILGLMATLLLCPGLGARIFGSDVVVIMLAEILMFPSLRISKSIMDSQSVVFAVQGTFYSQENCLIAARLLSFTFGRFATPPMTRWIIHRYGRFFYMVAQLCLNCLGCMTVFKATQAANTLRAAK